jgi:hypothetical protein
LEGAPLRQSGPFSALSDIGKEGLLKNLDYNLLIAAAQPYFVHFSNDLQFG